MKTKKYFFIGLIIIIIPNIIWAILGENSYVLIHDNLDSEFLYVQQLLHSQNLLGFDLNAKIQGVMEGVPRFFYRSGFNFTFIIFSLFPPFFAYLVLHLIVHTIGYIGMFILLKKNFIQKNDILTLAISICFGFLGYYYTSFGISIAGQPLLLFAFLNLLNNKKEIYNWLIISLFPFFSFLPITLPFFIPLLSIIALNHFISKKEIPWKFIIGIFLISIINLLLEFNLAYSSLFSEIKGHRTQWQPLKAKDFSFIFILKEFIRYSVLTYYHAGTLLTIPAIISTAIFLTQNRKNKTVNFIVIFLITVVIYAQFKPFIMTFLGEKITFFRTFNIARFYLIASFLCLLLLGITLNEIKLAKRKKQILSIILIGVTFITIIGFNPEIIKNIKLITKFPSKKPVITYSQFFATDLFQEIKTDLNLNPENLTENRTLSVGMHPSIAQYNGIYTLDSYQNNYALEYKNKFRKIIAKELDKNIKLKNYFDYWGSRCYAFSAEIGREYLIGKNNKKEISNLEYNWEVFKEMNGKYIFSSVKINTEKQPLLKFLKAYSSEKSFWKIYVYEVL